MSISNSKRTLLNLISSIGVMAINFLVSFFLSPYIVSHIGVEAYGLSSLSGSFSSYANLVVVALNAMAARYITLSYVKKDYEKANLYYNSVFWGNLIIVAVLFLPAVIFVADIDKFISVPKNLVFDTKIVFAITFGMFFLQTGLPNWDCGTYITNRLDRQQIPNIFSSVLRCVMLVAAFSFFEPHVWYVTVVGAILGIFSLAVSWYNTYTLTPELKITLRRPVCSWSAIKELVGSGIWSSIAISGNTLLSGLDLLVCNLFLGANSMGVLSVAKTLPNILIQFAETIRGTFGPELTINYAQGNKDELIRGVRRSMKIAAMLVSLAMAGVMVMSDAFYALWQPTQDSAELQKLTVLSILMYLTDSSTYVLLNVFPTYNKVKVNSIAVLISGLLSIGVTFLLLRFTSLGIYAVAGVSSVISIFRSMCFTIPTASRYLGLKWYTFYPQVLQSLFSCGVVIASGLLVRKFVPVDSWLGFIVAVALICVISMSVNSMILFRPNERKHLIHLGLSKFNRK